MNGSARAGVVWQIRCDVPVAGVTQTASRSCGMWRVRCARHRSGTPAGLFVLVFIALPIGLAALASGTIVRFVRNPTRRLAVGTYVMLVCAFVTPAPIVWGDDHLGFTSSQALEGYGALFWIVGAVASLDVLTGVMKRRQVLALAFGLILATILIGGWALAGVGAALGLALIPGIGALEVLLALGWLARPLAGVASASAWWWSAGAGATFACAIALYVYLRGPQAFGAHASAMDLGQLAVVVWLPVLGRDSVLCHAQR
jgi:hypothetical protein